MRFVLTGTFAALSIIATNSFALEITNGKILSQKDFTIGAVKSAKFIETKNKSFDLKVIRDQLSATTSNNGDLSDNWVALNIQAYQPLPVGSIDDLETFLSSTNYLDFYNYSKQPKAYTVTAGLCVYALDRQIEPNCSNRVYEVSLDGDGSINGDLYHLAYMKLAPGKYTQVTSLIVQRHGDTTSYVTNNSLDFEVQDLSERK
jgi:hypothetical protein